MSRTRILGTLALLAAPLAAQAPPVTLDSLVTTGTLLERSLSASPIKVEVISARFLQRALTNSLLESVQLMTGLGQQVDCGVCYTSNIRINGMEGPYTAVLIDGAPLMSSLATVYGLSGINPAIVERVEIIRGPMSTLYGSEAMGGVINVITKDPRFAPALSVSSYATSHGETNLDLAAAPRLGGARLLLSGSLARNAHFVDGNGDNFSDLPLVTRGAVFAKLSVGPPARRVLDLSAKVYAEDRFGGVREWTRAHRGSDQVYGESIRTRRAELVAGWRPGGDPSTRLDLSATVHDQDSWYGNQPFQAVQWNGFAQLVRAVRLHPRHELLAGAAMRLDHYDDDTPATAAPERRLIPGVLAQLESQLAAPLTSVAGMRVDHHAAHGAIVSPRLGLRWTPALLTTIRLSAATGFRVVSVFTEDHAALTGARTVTIAEELRPERSRTATISVQQVLPVGDDAVTVELDGFLTRFTNKIQPDYNTDPARIIYANLRGHATTRGVSISVNAPQGALPVGVRAGGTWQRVETVTDGTAEPLEFAPGFKGEFTLSREWEGSGLTLDWTGRVVGSMQLPEFPGKAARSPWYTEQALQVTKRLATNTFLIGAIRNLGNYRQADPIINPQDPFGPDFDTFHVYGPVQGRRVMVGLQHNLPR
ncbi:MAG: TonB-dependent receptor plug domain-containing protein [Gemmatimonadales bacterium]